LQHRAVRRFIADHQQLEVGLFHQFVHAHIALGLSGLGELPSEVFGKPGVVVRQPVHTAQQATGRCNVIALWIMFQVTEKTFFGIAQGRLIHMLALRHAVFVEGFGLGLIQ